MKQRIHALYDAIVLDRPLPALLVTAAIVAWLTSFAPDFKPDASADSLLLENDRELNYYRDIAAKYGSDDFAIITYTPREASLFTQAALEKLGGLQEELGALEGVEHVVSILNVPLLDSPRISLAELSGPPRTLETPGIDLNLAKREFLDSPLYRRLLLSSDEDTTALLVYLTPDRHYEQLLGERERMRSLKRAGQLDPEQSQALERAEADYKAYKSAYVQRARARIDAIRTVMDRHRDVARMFLGGIPMIVADMLDFIQSDLLNFGIAVALFLLLTLAVIFRKPRWVMLPMLCAGLTVASMIGLMGWIDWPVSVVSANFAALLLIITISMTIHLTVRYRETQVRWPDADKRQWISETMRFMFRPCLYTSLTTIVAFVSLLVSGIRPVIDFGQIMTLGIAFAFFLVFLLFPTVLMLLPKDASTTENAVTAAITRAFARFTEKHYLPIFLVAVGVALLAGWNIMQLKVENRFIDYFKDSTEIYQGMLIIDRDLGGTTPFDLILDAPRDFGQDTHDENAGSEIDPLADYFEDETIEQTQEEYWLSPGNIEKIKQVHDYLDSQPEIGKVLSLATLVRLAEILNEDRPLEDVETGFLRKALPEDIRRILLDPYLSEDGRQLRFSMRVIDSDKQLSRAQLIARIQTDVETKLGYPEERFRLTGVLVLYNNMLQSLYESQILTIGAVFLAILLMFIVLFRSPALAAIAIAPNLLAAASVLGFMGWRGIPLDIMTITIAAISVGIAVDNTIHYIIRFKREFVHDRHYVNAIKRCHGSIGRAMYYTSITIIVGFSILSLSNFIPTIYFGLLTSLAMFAALIASLTLLPSLLILFKPLGKTTPASAT